MFDENPVTPGHLLVIPKEHTLSLMDLHQEAQNSLFDTLKE